MHAAQSTSDRLTLVRRDGFTAPHMQIFRGILVLLGIVLLERAYIRSGG